MGNQQRVRPQRTPDSLNQWSLKIGQIAGIDLYIHATFLLIIGYIALINWLQTRDLGHTLVGVAFTMAIFLCVVLHELGHALTAQKFGIHTRDITLLPIGGVARLERMPEDPIQELWVALAGPAVNVVIAGLLYSWLAFNESLMPLGEIGLLSGPFLMRLMFVNLFLVLFNLIPAFPMDGGRVLRALLATRLPYPQATQVAAMLGQGIAFLFGFIGIFTNPMLVFIAFFVWIGASQEASMVQMKSALSGIPVSAAMVTDFHVLSPYHTLHDATQLTLRSSQHDFPVIENDTVVGILTRQGLVNALSKVDAQTSVKEVMDRHFEIVYPTEMLETAFSKLQACNCHTMPVVYGDRLVGLLTAENLGEFIMIQTALGTLRPARMRRIARSQEPVGPLESRGSGES